MKPLKFDAFNLAAVSIIALAIILRIALLSLGWPPLDSDEGTIGLMGMHIAYRGEWPIFFYGQGYMGAFEAYLAAIMFRLLGISTVTLSLGLVLMYGIFLGAIYALTNLLYSKKLALFVLVLLCLGSNPMLSRELVAIGGYPETLFLGTLVMLLASWLVLTSERRPSAYSRTTRRRRLITYAAWGLSAGIGIWTHMLIAPFVLMSGLLLLCFCWRELLGWSGVLLVVMLVLGMLPMILYNVTAAPGQDTLSYLLRVHGASGHTLPPWRVRLPQQLAGAFLVALPTATGAHPLCSAADALAPGISNWHAIHCTLTHAGWSLGSLLLWLCATILALIALWPTLRKLRGWSSEERRGAILHSARLALLFSAALTMLLYVVSPDAVLFPVATSRYLVGLLVATPAVLWPLWSSAHLVKPQVFQFSSRISFSLRPSQVGLLLSRGVLALLAVVFFAGTFSIFSGIPASPPAGPRWGASAIQVNDQHLSVPAVQSINRQQYALIDNLLQHHIYHIYSDYWTCNRLMFQSQERVICSVLNDSLNTGQNRYQPYRATVAADPQAAYVLEAGSPQSAVFVQRQSTAGSPYQNYQRLEFNGYIIYMP